uniref:Secreted protein n=1 Tax=Nelumbo nucifera TaxID=4432 RepID=A0A822XGZ8_NELNU|nr:TPA_asm: hypothetical protein HUJ06_021123 [Nelumbo nucifera]
MMSLLFYSLFLSFISVHALNEVRNQCTCTLSSFGSSRKTYSSLGFELIFGFNLSQSPCAPSNKVIHFQLEDDVAAMKVK